MTTGDAETPSLSDLVSALRTAIGNAAAYEVETLLKGLVSRLIEMTVLADDSLAEVARYPEVYLADASGMVGERVEELGLSSSLSAADLRRIEVTLLNARESGKDAAITYALESTVMAGEYGTELRCRLCGYHFRAIDLTADRTKIVSAHGLKLANRHLPQREEDPYKNPRDAALEMDHVTPRLAWGVTRASNIQVLCRFCNQGKLAMVTPGELLPSVMAGSLSGIFGHPPLWLLRQSLVLASWRTNASCENCNRTSERVELTIRSVNRRWNPWSCRLLCYDCTL